MGLGEHAGFIITGYLISFAVIVGAVVLSLAHLHRVQSQIDQLEARGIRRRSDKKPDAALADQRSKA